MLLESVHSLETRRGILHDVSSPGEPQGGVERGSTVHITPEAVRKALQRILESREFRTCPYQKLRSD